jgi:hypothetical protein
LLKIKIVIAISIFLTLFGSAWFMHHTNKRYDVEGNMGELNHDMSIQLVKMGTQSDMNYSVQIVKAFKPREYIRIVKRLP